MAEPKWKDNYGVSPVYILNRFIEDKLQEMGFIDMSQYKSDYVGGTDYKLPFMVPGQDLPEMTTIYDDSSFKDLAYCIYSMSHRASPDELYMYCGQVAYNFFYGDIDMLIALGDYLDDLLKRDDWTAQDVNNHHYAPTDNPFDFKWVSVLTTAGPAPTGDEGGRNSFMVVVRFDAVYEGTGRSYPDTVYETGMR